MRHGGDFGTLPAGVAAAVWDGGEIRVSGPPEPLPVFSVTKMFVAVAVLRLSGEGSLDLGSPLADVVPEAPAVATVRDVLRHTAGLGDYIHTRAYRDAVADTPADPWPLTRIVAAATGPTPGGHTPAEPARSPRPSRPRGAFSYSNAGYWLIGELLERVCRRPLPQVLHELVFAPAGMGTTRYPSGPASLTPDGYSTLWAGPAGACWSNPADLVRFLRSPGLPPEAFLMMLDGVAVDAGEPWKRPGYGLGAMVDTRRGTWGHGGGGPGYSSAAFATVDGRRCAAAIAPDYSGVDPVRWALRFLSRGD